MRALIALVLATAALSGCGGGESEADKGAEKQLAGSGAPTPVCVDRAETASVPGSFPADFPLPEDSVVYASERRSGGRTIVYAVVDTAEKDVLAFLQKAVPAAGYRLTEGEVEERDAESNWVGNGFTGRWAIREVAGCSEQTSVTVLSAKD